MAGPGDYSRQLFSTFQDTSSIAHPSIREEWDKELHSNSLKLLLLSILLHILLAVVSHMVMPTFNEWRSVGLGNPSGKGKPDVPIKGLVPGKKCI